MLALQKRGVSLINARTLGLHGRRLLMMGMGFVGIVESPYAAIALLSLGGFAHQTLSVTVITMSSDLFKRSEVATVAGMAGTFGNAGLLIFSLLIGGLVATVGYTPFFIGLAVLDLVGAALLWTLVRDPDATCRGQPAAAPREHGMRSRHGRHAFAIRSCRASTPIRRSCGSATTTTSRRRRSSGFPACRSITRAIWCTGVC